LKASLKDNADFVTESKNFVMVNLEDDEEPKDPGYAVDGGLEFSL